MPGIVSPRKITVKGAPPARRLLRNRKPLSSDPARQVLGSYRKDGAERVSAWYVAACLLDGIHSAMRTAERISWSSPVEKCQNET